jgi:two-component system, cell cycle sensor histidine kinase and response regulator CckA
VIYYKATFGADGKTAGLVGAIMDITDRKRWEEEKISLQKRLYQSQKLEAVGIMANGIAHNFNNILAAIRGYADMALDDVPEGSRTSGDLRNIIKSVESSQQIVSQMLTFSRMDQQGMRKVEAAVIVKDAVKMYRASFKGRVDIQEDIASNCGNVLIDGVQLQQVILNLCGNSVHAITGSGGVIEVSVAAVSIDPAFAEKYVNLHEGAYVRIRIKDTGCGMSEETIEHIFEPFFTTKEVGKGTGLGLFMVRKIVVESGGEIMVTSKVGQGTSVDIYLPRVEVEA